MAAHLVSGVAWQGSSHPLTRGLEIRCEYIHSRHHIMVTGNLGLASFVESQREGRTNLLPERQNDCRSLILGVMCYLRGGAVREQSLLNCPAILVMELSKVPGGSIWLSIPLP